MPHLVTSLFRSSTHSFNHSKGSEPKPEPKPSRSSTASCAATESPSSSSSSSIRRRRPSFISHRDRTSSLSLATTNPRSSADTIPPPPRASSKSKMSQDKQLQPHHNHHRLSFGLHLGRSHHPSPAPLPATLEWDIETPPVMLHGRPDDSTGALVSGLVKLDIKADVLEIASCNAALSVRVVQKRPYQTHCKECEGQITELKSWRFLPANLAMQRGSHAFPFSALIDGHLPATMDSAIGSISYEFMATATTTSNQSIKMQKTIPVRRTIPETGQDHHSVRVFPPTNIAANVYYPSVIHPGHENILRLHMNGLSRIMTENVKHPQVEYWKLRKLSWRLDETAKMVAPACEKHCPRASNGVPARKGMQRSDTHAIGFAEMAEGWKAVYTPHDSEMEIDLKYTAQVPRRGGQRPVCDLKANDGTEITHSLVLEMVVVQEVAPVGQPNHCQPTGTARILRMHFNTILTEESAEGEVSWDCEAPPIYEDVPPSPPAYPTEDAPAYGLGASSGSSGSGSSDPYLDALVLIRQESMARSGPDGLPDTFDSGSASGSTGILEARSSSEGRTPSFP
ncbi:uncharacterized protein MKZ38_000313 [Zalerion maritima]|uniref:LDB19 N-terminal domain-containing protein n=1 Tax=Zalerion maritima TaxID=339359 RepID=A0AAD5WU49_9PEZI|nr:uncharacterized protein MKZ38_000313 [Zalerion maritima]